MNRSTELFVGLNRLFRLYDKMLKQVCAEHDLTMIEADIISFLQNNPKKDTARDIVELRMLSKAAVSKGVDSLIHKSLLERVPDEEDRRVTHLRLLNKAIPITASINKVRDEFLDAVFTGFSKEELVQHTKFIDKLFKNIQDAMEERNWS